MAILFPVIEGKAPISPLLDRAGGAFWEQLGSKWCLASVGGGAAFLKAAAEERLQGNGCFNASDFLGISSGLGVKLKEMEIVAWERGNGIWFWLNCSYWDRINPLEFLQSTVWEEVIRLRILN